MAITHKTDSGKYAILAKDKSGKELASDTEIASRTTPHLNCEQVAQSSALLLTTQVKILFSPQDGVVNMSATTTTSHELIASPTAVFSTQEILTPSNDAGLLQREPELLNQPIQAYRAQELRTCH
jgi:hypothetical protein